MVVHGGGTEEPNSYIVRELYFVDISAVVADVCTIVNVPVCIHESHALDPREGSFRVLRISLVVGVSSKPGRDVEKCSVGNGVLVIVSDQIWVDLPSQAIHTSAPIHNTPPRTQLTLHHT